MRRHCKNTIVERRVGADLLREHFPNSDAPDCEIKRRIAVISISPKET